MDNIKVIGIYKSIGDSLRSHLTELYIILLVFIFILLLAVFAYLLKEW